jgi:hypothetical protein
MFRLSLTIAVALSTTATVYSQSDPSTIPLVDANQGYLSETSSTWCPPPTIDCARGPRCWANAEYVFWTIGTGKLVEAAKESYNSDLFNALLNAAGKDYLNFVETLLGNNRSGFRLSAGAWIDDEQTVGVEAGFLHVNRSPLVLNIGQRDLNPLEEILGNRPTQTIQRTLNPLERLLSNRQANNHHVHLDGPLRTLLLLRRFGLPAIDSLGRTIIVPFGRRDLANGSATFEIADQTLWIMDLGGRVRLFNSDGITADGLVGYRRVSYEDSMSIRSQSTTLAPPLLPGSLIQSVDMIQAENTYDGVLLGVDLALQTGSWTFAVRPTATIAAYRSEVIRAGATTVTFADDRPRLAVSGGTYLRAEDLGTFTTTGWTVLPEIGLRAARALGENVRLTFGTSLLYLPEVARTGPQIEIGLDPARTLPGALGTYQPRTVQPPEMRSAFLTTITLGLELHF